MKYKACYQRDETESFSSNSRVTQHAVPAAGLTVQELCSRQSCDQSNSFAVYMTVNVLETLEVAAILRLRRQQPVRGQGEENGAATVIRAIYFLKTVVCKTEKQPCQSH